ncbi:hypothetical protein PAHAL_3G031500 [Panicum hallii]|uniref:Uncharacterized protein n=1 Tax=Panicum hallii TaxID=206008 RepID=A0A2T8KGV3_9POAL|nr:hypothetical protein PAHAL_3G031500 [Panicum hallii]
MHQNSGVVVNYAQRRSTGYLSRRIIPSNILGARSRCRTTHWASTRCAPRGSGRTRRRGREPRGEWGFGGRRGSGEAMRAIGTRPQVEEDGTRTKRGKRVKEN